MERPTFTRFNGEPDFNERPHTRPFSVGIGQFYITNVCNLSCEDCCSFNNFKFKGHLSWDSARERVEAWARLLDIDYLCVIGGEPFASPELDTWVRELRRLWPRNRREFSIVTNGTYLRANTEQVKDYMELGVTIEVSVHDPAHWQDLKAWADELCSDLAEPVTVNIDRDPVMGIETHNYHVGRQRILALGTHWRFGPSAVKRYGLHGLEFHRSDVNTAHSVCPARDCHYFVNGVMYKCPVTATGAMLTEQFAMAEDQRDLLLASKGCDPLTAPTLNSWFANLPRAVPQCSLCPESWEQRKDIFPLNPRKPEVARISLDSLTTAQAHPANLDGDAVPLDSSSQA